MSRRDTLVDHQIYDNVVSRGIVRYGDEDCIQPASLDVRLGYSFIRFNRLGDGKVIDPYDEATYPRGCNIRLSYGESLIIEPLEFMLATTVEVFKMPSDMYAVLHGKSSIGRLGLFIHNAGLIDQGFRGEITLELFNAGPNAIRLYEKMPIAQVTFHKTKPCESPYDTRRSAKYHDQNGATMSRYHENPANCGSFHEVKR